MIFIVYGLPSKLDKLGIKHPHNDLGKSNDQCPSITKRIIYYFNHMYIQYFTLEVDWPAIWCLINGSTDTPFLHSTAILKKGRSKGTISSVRFTSLKFRKIQEVELSVRLEIFNTALASCKYLCHRTATEVIHHYRYPKSSSNSCMQYDTYI